MRTRRSRRAARYAWLTVALAAVFGLASGMLATPAHAADAAVVITGNRLEGPRNVPFNLRNFAPGDTAELNVVVRNDTNRAAQVTYTGAGFREDALAEHAVLTIKREGVVLATGPADSARLTGATLQVGPRTATRLGVELSMPRGQGNAAQGKSMRVVFRFEIKGGSAEVGTGDWAPPTNTGATGVSGRDSWHTGATTPMKDVLPPTGESLGAFHVLVWAALGAFAGLLVALTIAAARRRNDAQLRPVTIFDDVPADARPDRR